MNFPLALDLDGSLRLQPDVLARVAHVADWSGREQELRLSATPDAAERAVDELRRLRTQFPGPWLTFIGSGDFHHLSLLLLRALPESANPFSLVLVDNHPDWFREKPANHCGNWVSSAMELAGLSDATLLGQASRDLYGHRFRVAPWEDLCGGRLVFHPLRKPSAFVPFKWPTTGSWRGPHVAPGRLGTRLRFETLREGGVSNVFRSTARRLAGRRVYVSVDKDCLRPQDARADWGQGRLTLDELTDGIRAIAGACELIGADVCGERAARPLRGLWKRIDAGRLFGRKADPAADALNARANLRLLDAFGLD